MSRTMECLQIESWGGELKQATKPIPSPDPTEVLIEVEAVSVGLTVHNSIQGDLGNNPEHLPRIPGHEVIGRIAKTGIGVDSLEAGDPVGVYFYLNCGHCLLCESGYEPLCENFRGYTGIDIDGGFAEYMVVPAENALSIPAQLDPVDASVIPDALATSYHIVNQRARVTPGDDVLILGAGGGVGIHLLQMVQYFGGRSHALDQASEKLKYCRNLGASSTINTRETVLTQIDHVFDVIVDFTGSIDLIESALSHLAPRGRLVNLTTFPGRSINLSLRDQVLQEAEVVGSRYCSKNEFLRCGELLAEGVIEPVVSDIVALDDVPDLLSRITDDNVTGRGALVF